MRQQINARPLAPAGMRHAFSWIVVVAIQVLPHSIALADEVAAQKVALFISNLAPVEDEADERSHSQQRAVAQMRFLEAALRRGDYSAAEQLLQREGAGMYFDAKTEAQWSELRVSLFASIREFEEKASSEWYQAVRKLAQESREAMLKAKDAADLDRLTLEAGTLQQTSRNSRTPMDQRSQHILLGTIASLQAWAQHLDFQRAGKPSAANEILTRMLSDNSNYPVLTAEEIRQRLQETSPSLSEGGTQRRTGRLELPDPFAAIRSLEDLATLLEHMDDPNNPASNYAKVDPGARDSLKALLNASTSLKAGQVESAARYLRASTHDRFQSPTLNRLYESLAEEAFYAQVQSYTTLKPVTGEDHIAYRKRVLEELEKSRDYDKMQAILGVMPFLKADRIAEVSRESHSSLKLIRDFLAAQKFEEAGDITAAVTNYRTVAQAAGTPWAPTDEAAKALARLQASHPEAFTEYYGELVNEMRALRDQLHRTNQSLMRGRPIP